MLPFELKEKVYNSFLLKINTRIKELQQQLDDLKEIGSNETKSTAGDKHETALAMIQIGQTQYRNQLNEAVQLKENLEKLNISIPSKKIINGSLIKTNKGILFLSVALGKIKVEGMDIIALSVQSPLGHLLIGLKEKEIATFNNIEYTIETIL